MTRRTSASAATATDAPGVPVTAVARTERTAVPCVDPVLVRAARTMLVERYLEVGVHVGPGVLVRTAVQAAVAAYVTDMPGDLSETAETAAEKTAPQDVYLGAQVIEALAADGTLAPGDSDRWVLAPNVRWAALVDADGQDWLARGPGPSEPAWAANATRNELRTLAAAGARSDRPRRALAYAVEVVSGSQREAAAAVALLADFEQPAEAAALLAKSDGPLTPTAIVALVRGVLTSPA